MKKKLLKKARKKYYVIFDIINKEYHISNIENINIIYYSDKKDAINDCKKLILIYCRKKCNRLFMRVYPTPFLFIKKKLKTNKMFDECDGSRNFKYGRALVSTILLISLF